MEEKTTHHAWRERTAAAAIYGGYIAAGSLLATWYRWQINPDGISYISIARHYLEGDWYNAINAYWGPLFSWLLVPLLAVGIPPIVACKILNLGIGLVLLACISHILKALDIKASVRTWSTATAAVATLYFALTLITPDLLLATILTAYAGVMVTPSQARSKRGGATAGTLGGLLYLAKQYGLVLFLCHFITVNILSMVRDKANRKATETAFATGLYTFIFIAGTWIGLMSLKYGTLTLGTSAAYNYTLSLPASPGHPMHWAGLIPPPNPTAVSAWEETTRGKVMTAITADKRRLLSHILERVLANIKTVISFFLKFSVFSISVILMAFVILADRETPPSRRYAAGILLSLVGLSAAGYLPLFVEERYLWPCCILLLLLTAMVADIVMKADRPGKVARSLVAACLLGSFIPYPANGLWKHRNTGKITHEVAKVLQATETSGKVASDGEWHEALYISFFNGYRYYGERGALSMPNFIRQLFENGIDYLLVFHPASTAKSLPPGFEKIATAEKGGKRLVVYRVPRMTGKKHPPREKTEKGAQRS